MNKTSAESTLHKYEPVSVFDTLDNTKRKYYSDVWKRALRKIKLSRALGRSTNFTSNELDVFSEGTVELMNFSKSRKSFTIIKSSSSFIILPYSPWYLGWIFLLLATMTYISTYGLFHSSFHGFDENSFESNYEIIIDLVFCIDVGFSFNLAYFNNDNKLVTCRKSIVYHYFTQGFLKELILSFPFGIYLKIFPESTTVDFFIYRQFMRLLKWLELLKRLDYLYFIKTIDHFCSSHRTLVKLLCISAILSLSLHIVACLMFLCDKSDTPNTNSMIFKSGLIDLSEGEQYLTYLYWALTTLSTIGYGDNVPLNTEEKLICMAWMAAGVFVVSVTVGQFNFLFNKLLASDSLLNGNILFATQFCHRCQIPTALAKRLKMCIRDKQILSHKFDISKFLTNIDMHMRYEIALNIYQSSITKVPFVIEKDVYFISFITFYLQFIQLGKNDPIWHKFAFPDGIYFITVGQVKLFYDDRMFMIYQNGDYTGDIEFFYKIKRRFDAFTSGDTEILKLSSKNLGILKKHFPVYYQDLKQKTKQRKTKVVHELAQMLLISECFKGGSYKIDPNQLAKLEAEVKHVLFSMRPGRDTKIKLRDLFGSILDMQYGVAQCKELIKNLMNSL